MHTTARKILTTLAMLSLGHAAIGCSEKDEAKETKLTLKVRNAGPTAQSLKQSASLIDSIAGNLSFTPESYKLWINTVVLQNDDGLSNQFYMCESSETDCEVDLADETSIAAFEAKLSALKISTGTYTKVWLSCSPDSGGYIKVKGQTTLTHGDIKYTANPEDNDGNPVTSDLTKAGTVKISITGCGITMPLAKPLVVGGSTSETQEGAPEGSTVTMTLFSNLYNQTYYGPNISGGMGGCVIATGATGGPGFCASYPSVFPYFGETTPTVEYYKVANSKTSSTGLALTDANVIVKVIKDDASKPFWASFSNTYTETTLDYGSGDKGVSGYANSVTAFAVNADGSLKIKSADHGFDAFERSEHTGQVTGEGIENGAGTGQGVTYYYKAFPFTP
ncbi:MAG: hypothetical protein M3Q07_24055 [Pseudobdellovibrionaceae bacterium]|nr:hypothetical protein [Pseudobdellovibrionaceae bacterium]